MPVMEAKTGLSDRALEAIKRLENIKNDPLGKVNRQSGHNHYAAARREAREEVVARKADGTPFSHIRDLQEAYNGLQNVRRALEDEATNLSEEPANADALWNKGIRKLDERITEVQNLLSEPKGFLNQIGYAPPYPPFHTWPPGA
jgi:uncharacterized protein (UPF0147 family)